MARILSESQIDTSSVSVEVVFSADNEWTVNSTGADLDDPSMFATPEPGTVVMTSPGAISEPFG